MAFKFVYALAFIAVASAGYIPTSQIYYDAPTTTINDAPQALAQNFAVKSEEHDPHPQYKYSYGVEDKLTGDSKSQVEERDGDIVRGEYSLIDSDGYKRTVQYSADDHNGFNAIVHREPLVKTVTHYAEPTILKTVTPVAHYTAPTIAKTVAPVAHYSTPINHYSTSAVIKTIDPHYTTPIYVKSTPVAHYTVPVQYAKYASPSYNYHN